MQQLRLVSDSNVSVEKSLTLQHIKAQFKKISQTLHDVVLEINSHKFLISIKTGLKKLEEFEIVAVKGFIEVGMKVVRLLRKIVSVLYFEY